MTHPPTPPFSYDFSEPVLDQERLDYLNNRRQSAIDYNLEMSKRGAFGLDGSGYEEMTEQGLITYIEDFIKALPGYLYDEIKDYIFGLGNDHCPSFGGSESITSPLVVDLDGDGIETTSVNDGVYLKGDRFIFPVLR